MSTATNKHDKLLAQLYQDYARMYAGSLAAHQRASAVLVDGVNHDARLFAPFPFRVTSAGGAYVETLDGHRLIDFWQGHFANILGHNPAVVREAMLRAIEQGYGLHVGLPEERQALFAETLARAVGAERVRLTTAGTLGTMYALMLARAYTGRSLTVKLSGGWHGANPLALKGTNPLAAPSERSDSEGIPQNTANDILVTPFNDIEKLHALFRAHGDRIAAFIMEPCMGRAGFIPASAEFMRAARALTEQHGALLILDEVITGFRYCASGVQKLYGVTADLSIFGKIIGGGMPIAAVAGRAAIMDLASQSSSKRVWFNGGTFSAHPLSVLAGQTMVDYLIAHEAEVYPALGTKGKQLVAGIEQVFADRGILARCTGQPDGLFPGSSLGAVYFPSREEHVPSCAEDLANPGLCDVTLQEQALKIGLLLSGVNVMHGLGALSLAHSDEDLQRVFQAFDDVAVRIKAEK